MARDYDSQLLESTAVRRKRLREAVFFGPQRTRRRLDENIGKVVLSLCLSAAISAGTVGWSFLQSQLRSQEEEQEQQAAGPDAATAPLPGDWVGAEVTFPMLREELDQAEVPPDLYVLPGDERPDPEEVPSQHLLTDEGEGGYSVGIVEFEQGRTGAEFRTEDEASRWLYQELATAASDVRGLGDEEERQAAEKTAELVDSVREKSGGQPNATTGMTLEPGQVVDAFGPESGSFLFPDGTPFDRRGLPGFLRNPPGGSEEDAYHRYRVAHPFPVEATLVPGENGGESGIRFSVGADGFSRPPELPSIRWLVRSGYLERVVAPEVPE
ncbi:TNT domain-containing protein [Allosalinactinospora lopnorensis]|uniref:TNT domain-containing protein n=1 Tax=Allosalinactinospora lopnorensis TaxID=1352348 RepID=UPI000623C816|nr:TNT domain-containing protein [Allosalinactinospora lopnorensis]